MDIKINDTVLFYANSDKFLSDGTITEINQNGALIHLEVKVLKNLKKLHYI